MKAWKQWIARGLLLHACSCGDGAPPPADSARDEGRDAVAESAMDSAQVLSDALMDARDASPEATDFDAAEVFTQDLVQDSSQETTDERTDALVLEAAAEAAREVSVPVDVVAEIADEAVSDARRRATGCADGTREAFVDEVRFPSIAGCAGAWSLPGVHPSPEASCGRNSGNDSTNPTGMGCSAEDLCAVGFHLCTSASDVAINTPNRSCMGAEAPTGTFFATGQSSTGCDVCALGGLVAPECINSACNAACLNGPTVTNDFYGCGTLGTVVLCGGLERASGNLCAPLGSSWSCGTEEFSEANRVRKTHPSGGGDLCCSNGSSSG